MSVLRTSLLAVATACLVLSGTARAGSRPNRTGGLEAPEGAPAAAAGEWAVQEPAEAKPGKAVEAESKPPDGEAETGKEEENPIDIEELERRVEILAGELERLRRR